MLTFRNMLKTQKEVTNIANELLVRLNEVLPNLSLLHRVIVVSRRQDYVDGALQLSWDIRI